MYNTYTVSRRNLDEQPRLTTLIQFHGVNLDEQPGLMTLIHPMLISILPPIGSAI